MAYAIEVVFRLISDSICSEPAKKQICNTKRYFSNYPRFDKFAPHDKTGKDNVCQITISVCVILKFWFVTRKNSKCEICRHVRCQHKSLILSEFVAKSLLIKRHKRRAHSFASTKTNQRCRRRQLTEQHLEELKCSNWSALQQMNCANSLSHR